MGFILELIFLYTCTCMYIIPPLFREGAILQSPCPSVRTDISASTEGIDLKFCIQLQHDVYSIRFFFQVHRTPTSCFLDRLGLFLGFKMRHSKIFVTDSSAFTEGIDLKYGIQLQHDQLYRASPFQVCRTSTSCLPSRLR